MVGWGRGTTDKKEANTIGTWFNKCERRLILWLLLTVSMYFRNNEITYRRESDYSGRKNNVRGHEIHGRWTTKQAGCDEDRKFVVLSSSKYGQCKATKSAPSFFILTTG